jgi:long-chain acyl-CoA synthetase|tara:strand:+ start:26031 stop:27611 length:1581 start_codon:yes stop_codon:yes gene_type:complete
MDDTSRNIINRVAMGDVFRRKAATSPNLDAIVEYRNNERLAYTHLALNKALNKVDHMLRALNIKQGDRVALASPNSIEFALVIYGCMKAGVVVVPVNYLQGPSDLVFTLNHCEAKAIFIEDSLVEKFEECKHELNVLKHWISIPVTGCNVPDSHLCFNQLLESAADKENEDLIISDRDPLQILYTSGTTSKPKGVETSHLALFINSLSAAIELGIKKEGIGTSVMPMFHCAQHLISTSVLHMSGTVLIFRTFESEDFVKIIEKEKVNFIFLLPLMWKALLEVPNIEKYDFSALDTCMYAMAPMDKPSLLRLKAIFKCPFILGSGQTEMTPVTTVFHDKWSYKDGNYWGEALTTTDQAVMDDNGVILPDGEIGEIVWRSPSAMNSYYKDPEATAEVSTFGWHHSGDLGYFDEDHQLMFVDRKKDMIKTGGENVASVKVERVIMSHPSVAGVTVIGLPHPHWTEAVTAIVIPKPNVDITETDLIKICKNELAGYEVPKRILFVNDIAKTATGKFLKAPLREKYANLYL